jgi:hypothetical protein
MLRKLGAFFLLLSIVFSGLGTASAIEIVDEVCNDQARLGAWMKGVSNKEPIRDIVSEFPPEHQKVVSFLNSLPVRTGEQKVLAGMGKSPTRTIRIVKEFVLFQWEFPGSKSTLAANVYVYKGCIRAINLTDIKSSSSYNLYFRQNQLPVVKRSR